MDPCCKFSDTNDVIPYTADAAYFPVCLWSRPGRPRAKPSWFGSSQLEDVMTWIVSTNNLQPNFKGLKVLSLYLRLDHKTHQNPMQQSANPQACCNLKLWFLFEVKSCILTYLHVPMSGRFHFASGLDKYDLFDLADVFEVWHTGMYID